MVSPKADKTVMVFWILIVLYVMRTGWTLVQSFGVLGMMVGGTGKGNWSVWDPFFWVWDPTFWHWFCRFGYSAPLLVMGAVLLIPMLWDLARNEFLRNANVLRLRLLALVTFVQMLGGFLMHAFAGGYLFAGGYFYGIGILVEASDLLSLFARGLFWLAVSCVVAFAIQIKEEQQLTV